MEVSFDDMRNAQAVRLGSTNVLARLHPSTRSEYTSPTNVGMYFWATLAARDLGFIGADEAVDRIALTLEEEEHERKRDRGDHRPREECVPAQRLAVAPAQQRQTQRRQNQSPQIHQQPDERAE